MTELSEHDTTSLLNRIGGRSDQADKDRAFTTLYLHFRPALFKHVMRLSNHDKPATEDILQSVFLDLVRKPTNFQGNSSFSTWLHSVATNKAKDWFAKQGRIRRLEAASLDESHEAIAAPSQDILDALLDEEAELLLKKCLDELPEHLRVLQAPDDTLKVMAERMGISEGTLKSRSSRGRDLLKLCVERSRRQEVRHGGA